MFKVCLMVSLFALLLGVAVTSHAGLLQTAIEPTSNPLLLVVLAITLSIGGAMQRGSLRGD